MATGTSFKQTGGSPFPSRGQLQDSASELLYVGHQPRHELAQPLQLLLLHLATEVSVRGAAEASEEAHDRAFPVRYR